MINKLIMIIKMMMMRITMMIITEIIVMIVNEGPCMYVFNEGIKYTKSPSEECVMIGI